MSAVVHVSYPEPHIAAIAMEDRANRNTLSAALMRELTTAFERVQQDGHTKVIVIHGYDTYFCCGGTQEELIKLTEGALRFSDTSFFRLLLDCELPTIAAMQGHALGGGLAFACYADLLVMADEMFYSANFMKYGFTPGMGATHIIPHKFGSALGAELLFTAEGYRGVELRARGVGARVVRREQVLDAAMALARSLAQKPLISLKLLKRSLADPIRQTLPKVVEAELAMHEVTFQLPEVRERILANFGK